MFRKLFLLIISIILLSSLVSAAEREIIFDYELNQPYEFEGKEFPVGLRMYEIPNIPFFAVLNGSIDMEDSKTYIDGLLLLSMSFHNSKNEIVKQKLLGNGQFEVIRTTRRLKGKSGTEVMTQITFTTKKGIIKIGDYLLKCNEECKLSFEVLGDEIKVKNPWINIEGTAELSKADDKEFKPLTLTDLKYASFWEESVENEEGKEPDELFKSTAIGLKKTSSFNGLNIQTQKPVIFTMLNKKLASVEIFNPATLRGIPEDNLKFYVYNNKKARLNVWIDKKKTLTLTSGLVELNNNFNDYKTCTGGLGGCIMVDDSSIRVQPKTISNTPMNAVVYPTNKEVVFDKIEVADPSSSFLSKGSNKLEFIYDLMKKIPKKVSVFSFKTDFTAQLYSDEDKLYHEYKCLWKERKCFYDDKEVYRGFTDLRLCSDDSECEEDEFCSQDPKCESDENYCAEKRCLKEATCEETGNSPGRILFVADGYPLTASGEQEFRSDVNDLMNNGLYTFEPFNDAVARSAFSPIYIQVGSLPSRFDGAPLIDLAQNYRSKCESQIGKKIPYTVVLSKGGKAYRAFAHLSRDVLVLPLSSGALTSDDRRTFVHEFGHLFADLADEYIGPSGYFTPPYWSFPNCAEDELQAKSWLKDMGLNEEAYGNFQYKGCGGDCPYVLCSGYIRPDDNSIMSDHNTGGFNEPSKWAIKKKLRELTGLGGIL